MAKHRVCCTYCCYECGRHFASLEAWDLHKPQNGDGRRHCVAPETVRGATPRHCLVEKATDATCAISSATEVHGVTVWQTAAAQLSGSRPA